MHVLALGSDGKPNMAWVHVKEALHLPDVSSGDKCGWHVRIGMKCDGNGCGNPKDELLAGQRAGDLKQV